jgi:GMP synthase-like glutamine amidotransferase
VDTALILQTQDNCSPGLLCDWAQARSISLDVLRVDRWTRLPSPEEYSAGVLLGSDASLTEVSADWVVRELDWIAEADAAGLPLLGICFGAQALAVAFGGTVTRLPAPERAWIELVERDPAVVPAGPWVALHEDAVELPESASTLARNDVGVQAFAVGPHLGVQFHPEATPSDVARWAADKGRNIRADLLAGSAERFSLSARSAFALFDAFLERGRSRSITAEYGRVL